MLIEGARAFTDLMDLTERNMREFSPDLTVATTTNSFGSDHVSFQRAGDSAVLGIEQDDTDYPGYHRATDTVEYVSKLQSRDIIRGLAGALYDLAGVD